MVDEPELEEGKYPFNSERLPLSELAWIEVPASLESLLRDQIKANGIQLVRGQPVELRCVTPQYAEAVFMIFCSHEDERLHMLAPKEFQKGKA